MAKYKIIPSSRTIVQSPISIGHKAEKGVEAIEFDVTAWVETYGSGTLTVIMRRWGDAIPYPIALEIDENNKATWTLSDTDTAKAGMAYAQLNYIVGDEVVKKSDIYTFRVMDSLTGEGDPPEAYESWLEHLTHFAAEAMAEVLDIEGIVTDKTLTVDGGIADAKATGDALALKADKSTTYTKTEVDTLIDEVEVETDTTLEIAGAPADAAETGRQIGLIKADLNVHHINLFNPATITEGKYLDGNGGLTTNANFFASDFIDVSAYDTITLSYTHIAHWYKADKIHISAVDGMSTLNADATVTIPEDAHYLRFSTYNTNLNLAQVGQNVSRNDYHAYEYYKLPYLVLEKNDDETDTIIVDKSGNGDYTSFTEAVYDNIDNGKPIIVKAGTYDIVAEYVALFGQDVVDNLADSTSGINNFQYGIRIHDRKVTFEAGAHLICDWTGKTVNATHRFCALRIEPNAELIGLDLDCTNTFYCIHDDYGTLDNSPFTVTYINCRVIGHNLINANCIGGGAHKYSRHILENCYFNNNVESGGLVSSADVRYHNTNTADAEPEIFISNCYFSNNLNITYYGSQTTKMRAYVNNCYAPKGINKRAESSSAAVDNVELYTWNNQSN